VQDPIGQRVKSEWYQVTRRLEIAINRECSAEGRGAPASTASDLAQRQLPLHEVATINGVHPGLSKLWIRPQCGNGSDLRTGC
jgi:hypothetical protein